MFRKLEGPSRSKKYLQGIIADKNAALLVAESEGDIIGFIHVFIRQAPDIPILVPRQYASIDEMAVKNKFRGYGVGQSLLEKTHLWAQEKGRRKKEKGKSINESHSGTA